MVVLTADYFLFPLGSGDFVESFFYTVCIRAENHKWGQRFPCIMNELFYGELPYKHLKKARRELRELFSVFRQIPPSQSVWITSDGKEPWIDHVDEAAENLADFYLSEEKLNLIRLMGGAILRAMKQKCPLKLESVVYDVLSLDSIEDLDEALGDSTLEDFLREYEPDGFEGNEDN